VLFSKFFLRRMDFIEDPLGRCRTVAAARRMSGRLNTVLVDSCPHVDDGSNVEIPPVFNAFLISFRKSLQTHQLTLLNP
jgi:hypothetical protein